MQRRHAAQADGTNTQHSQLPRRTLLGAGAAVAAVGTLGLASPAFADTGSPANGSEETPFGPVDVAPGEQGFYARAVRLTAGQPAGKSKTVLATFQRFGDPVFPLYRSDDNGRNWGEYGKPDNPGNPDQNEYSYHVHYRLAKDPESFRFSADTPLLAPNSDAPNGSPIVSWSSWGGPNGTIIVTDNDHQDFFINRDLGDPAKWSLLSSPMPAGYSRFTMPLDGPGDPHNRGLVFVITGAQFGESAPVQAGVISVRD